jgi:hypothetical protein
MEKKYPLDFKDDSINEYVSETSWESVDSNEQLHKNIELELKRTELQKKQGEVKDMDQNRSQRDKYAAKIFVLMAVYLALTLLTVYLSATECIAFTVPTEVLVTLVATTAVEVIGLFVLVVKYLFR